MRRYFLPIALLVSACAPQAVSPDISVENAHLRMPLPGQSTAVAYFDVNNKGGADTLLSVTAPISDNVELHDHVHENGTMKMVRVDSVPIPANQIVQFKSGGLHIMLFEAEPVDGANADTITLHFEKSGDIDVVARPIE